MLTLKYFNSKLKNLDIFAKEVKFNINRNGETHKTTIGGIVSAYMKVIYFIYFMYLIQKMLYYKEDRTFTQLSDSDGSASIPIIQTDIKTYYNLEYYSPNGSMEQLFYNDEAKRFINI